MNLKKTIKLNTNLRQFGLNPREWVIEPQSKNLFRIAHKTDHDLQLWGLGQITSQGIQWTQLKWAL